MGTVWAAAMRCDKFEISWTRDVTMNKFEMLIRLVHEPDDCNNYLVYTLAFISLEGIRFLQMRRIFFISQP